MAQESKSIKMHGYKKDVFESNNIMKKHYNKQEIYNDIMSMEHGFDVMKTKYELEKEQDDYDGYSGSDDNYSSKQKIEIAEFLMDDTHITDKTFKNDKKIKHGFFKRLINYFILTRPFFSNFINVPAKKNEFELEFNSWLENKSFEFCAGIHAKGFKLHKEQEKKLFDGLKSQFPHNPQLIFNLDKIYTKIPLELFSYWVFNWFEHSISKNKSLNHHSIFQNQFKFIDWSEFINLSIQNIKDKQKNLIDNFAISFSNIGSISKSDNLDNVSNFLFSIQLFSLFLDRSEALPHINLNKSIFIKSTLTTLVNDVEIFVKSKGKDNYKEYAQKNLEYMRIADYKKELNNIFEKIDKNLIYQQKLFENKINQSVSDNLAHNLQDSINALEYKNISTLPKHIQTLISSIELQYSKIPAEIKTNNVEISSLYEKKLPDIIKKYLLIDSEYRESLTNVEGKKPIQLMQDSLNNIYHVFTEQVQQKNESLVSNLSITQRHIKSIKQNLK